MDQAVRAGGLSLRQRAGPEYGGSLVRDDVVEAGAINVFERPRLVSTLPGGARVEAMGHVEEAPTV